MRARTKLLLAATPTGTERDAIAQQACFSRYHFLRAFRRAFDITPHQHLTYERRVSARNRATAAARSLGLHMFYTDKLGFEVRTDATMEGFRWLTVGPKDQKNLEIVLMEPTPGMMFDEDTAKQMKALMAKGAFGAGVFHTNDCQATYEELKSRGVELMNPPQERPYGIEVMFKDNSGNWFSLTQPRQLG